MIFRKGKPKLHKLTPSLICLHISNMTLRITEDIYNSFVFAISENCWERPNVLLRYFFNYIRGDDDLRCYRCNKIHKYDKINDDASSTTSTTSSEGIIKLIYR